ncbi:MAG: ATP synthase F0 subunit C [Elusimicrobiota bacterium]|jgi:F-type H+-transporting ATPase subunit c
MSLWHLGLGYLAAGIGSGLIILGAASGIARLASAALEGTARQPEATDNLRTSMLIPAALIEGLGFFALVICLLIALALNTSLPKSGATAETSAAATK